MQPDPPTSQIIALVIDTLRERRVSMGMSKKKLAGMTGVSRTAILLMERHERSPSFELVLRIAHCLELPLGDVVTEAERKTRKS